MDLKKQRKISIMFSTGKMATLIGELLGAYAVYYEVTVRLIDPTISGMFGSISAIVGSLGAIIVGYIIDRYNLNKRKVTFRAYAITLVLFLLYFAPIDLGPIGITIWIGVIGSLSALAYSFFFTPFDAMGAELVTDSKIRTLFRTLCTVLTFVGIIFSNTLSAYFRAWLLSIGVGEYMSWFLMASSMAVIAGLAALLAWHASRGQSVTTERSTSEKREKKNLLKSYIDTLKVREIRTIFLWTTVFFVGNGFISSMLLYYGRFALGLSETMAATLFTASVVGTIAASPLSVVLAGKLGKKKALVIISFVYLFYTAYMLLTPQEGFTDGVVYAIAYSVMNIVVQSVAVSMLYDSTELVEFKLGVSKVTEALAILKSGLSIGGAIGVFLVGQVLSRSGFDAALTVQSEQTVDVLFYSCAFVPAGTLIISALIILFGYKLNEKNHEKLVAALELKREGKEYSTEGFEEVL